MEEFNTVAAEFKQWIVAYDQAVAQIDDLDHEESGSVSPTSDGQKHPFAELDDQQRELFVLSRDQKSLLLTTRYLGHEWSKKVVSSNVVCLMRPTPD